jgi:uncharacterized protein
MFGLPAMHIDVSELLREGIGAREEFVVSWGAQRLSEHVEIDSLKGTLELWRTTEGILVQGLLKAAVDLQCVRCLANVTQDIEIELDEKFQIPPILASEADQIYPIDADHHINLGPVLRELVIVSTPMHVLCKPDCAGLCPVCGQDLNQEPCDCQADDIDPRLADLKALLS